MPRAELRRRFEERAPRLDRDVVVVELMRATVLGPRDGHGGSGDRRRRRRRAIDLRAADGRRLETTLEPVPATAYVGAAVARRMDIWRPPPPVVQPPLWLRRPGSTRWFATLGRGRVVYAAYSRTSGSPSSPTCR